MTKLTDQTPAPRPSRRQILKATAGTAALLAAAKLISPPVPLPKARARK